MVWTLDIEKILLTYQLPLPGGELDVKERGDVGVVVDAVARVVLVDEGLGDIQQKA